MGIGFSEEDFEKGVLIYIMRINQLKAGVILSYATQTIHILTGLIYTPIMLRLLGQSEYGLYQLVYSVISYLSLLSLGFGSAYMRFYSRYKVDDDENGIAQLNGMFFVIFSVIAVVCLICGGVLVLNAKVILGNGLTENELYKARILMAIMVVSLACSFIKSVFSSIVIAHEQFFFQRVVEFLSMLLNPFLTLPLLIMGFGSVAMVTVSAALTFASLIINIFYCKRKLKTKFIFKSFNFALLKEMWIFTAFIFVGDVVNQINWSVDKFLLGRMSGTIAVAVYGVAGQLNSMYMSLSTSVSSVFTPRVNLMVAKENNNEKLTELFSRVGRIQFMILALVISGYVIFGRSFIHIWAGEEYGDSYRIGLFLLLPVTIPLIQNLGIQIQMAKNMHKFRSVTYLVIAVSNVFLSIWCINKWGTVGAAIGTAVSLILGNGILMNWYYYKKVGINVLYFWKQIIKFAPSITIAVIFGVIINKIFDTSTLIYLAVAIALYCLVYAVSIYFMGMNRSEKDLIKKPLEKIFTR
ncbi:MAG: oligosaccharide flippase family protein [bacterium]|nr:oligosaccharide flippase family protein [bacterium]